MKQELIIYNVNVIRTPKLQSHLYRLTTLIFIVDILWIVLWLFYNNPRGFYLLLKSIVHRTLTPPICYRTPVCSIMMYILAAADVFIKDLIIILCLRTGFAQRNLFWIHKKHFCPGIMQCEKIDKWWSLFLGPDHHSYHNNVISSF